MAKIGIEKKVLSANDEMALQNREFLNAQKVFTLNMLSSPGSGKTSVLEKTLEHFRGKREIYVLVGDVQTDNDARRLQKYTTHAEQIITGGSCHLNAEGIAHYLKKEKLDKADMLIIENVGNLVCPASFDLGEHKRAVVLSVTEGDDKPKKYPAAFRSADIVILNKMDLLSMTNFSLDEAEKNIRDINPDLRVVRTSCVTGEGLGAWYDWLEGCLMK
jgi:hydrogenase nickel incorporation protein HypB